MARARRSHTIKEHRPAWNVGIPAKWPRHYAAEIVELPTRDERAAALEKVPQNMRGLTRKHVEIHFMHKAFEAKKAREEQERVARKEQERKEREHARQIDDERLPDAWREVRWW